MSKIPVGTTIARAYNFAFVGFFNLLRLMWLPMAIMLTSAFSLRQIISSVLLSTSQQNLPSSVAIPLFALFYAVASVLMFIQITAVGQAALGQNTGDGWFYFPLGKPVWRLIGAFLLVILVIIGLWLLFILAIFLVGSSIGLAGMPRRSTGSVAIGFVLAFAILMAFCAFIYLMIRLTFFVIPVTIAERRVNLRQSWTLGRSNFWRMFTILLSVMLPFVALELLVIGYFFRDFPALRVGASPAAVQSAIAAWQASIISRAQHYWFVAYPGYAIFLILFYGVIIGAQCFAYRALVPAETEAEAFG